MQKSCTFMLTVAMGKRLIARGLMANPAVRETMLNHRLLITAGTTNGYIAEEVLRAIGDDRPFDKRPWRRGITVAPGASVMPRQADADLLIDHGKAYFDRDVFAIAPELDSDDMIMKGANALYMTQTSHCEAGVLIGHPQGGTMTAITAAAIGRRVQLIVPISLEKRVQRPISELVQLANAASGDGPRLAPIPGTPYTELDALKELTGCKNAELLASGGAMGAEGCLYLTVQDDEAVLERVKALAAELRGEPATAL